MEDEDMIRITRAAIAETGMIGEGVSVAVEGGALVVSFAASSRLSAWGMADAARFALENEMQFGPDFGPRFAPPFTPSREIAEIGAEARATLRWPLAAAAEGAP